MLDIIIACYNHYSFLNNCLLSIQTYIKDLSKIVVYICDDYSQYSEEYINLVKRYNSFFNCIYLKTEKNSGPGVARNLGLNKSNKNFVVFIDDDDEIVNDILLLCDNKYDFIISKRNYSEEIIDASINFCDSVQGIIFNNNFLKKNKLYFPDFMHDGCEDSVFRTICFFYSFNFKYENYQFYKRNFRENSNFTRNNFFKIKHNYQLDMILLKEKMIWLSCLFKQMNLLQFNKKNNDFFIKFYISMIFECFSLVDQYNEKYYLVSNLILLLIYGVLRFYNFNEKISFNLIENENDMMIIEFIDFVKENFCLKENIICLEKNYNIEDYINNSIYLINYKKYFSFLWELPQSSQYYDCISIINVFSKNYYKTQFENIREINHE